MKQSVSILPRRGGSASVAEAAASVCLINMKLLLLLSMTIYENRNGDNVVHHSYIYECVCVFVLNIYLYILSELTSLQCDTRDTITNVSAIVA